MKPSTAILGLLAETSIHAGAGHSVGAIDLPIQREAHSDWPCVFGSAIKGAMRSRSHDVSLPAEQRVILFGPDPETDNASDHAGALTITDARLVLLPVRSLTGHFKWATCPALLRRYQSDLRRLGLPHDFAIPKAEENKALVETMSNDDTTLFLEEFRLGVKKTDLEAVIAALARLLPEDGRGRLKDQLAVVEDDLFGHLARYCVPVTAHVRIKNDTKTVDEGALWYEESLPPETLLYVGLTAWRSRKKDSDKTSEDVLTEGLEGLFGEHGYLQIGGNETLGMGWCRVSKNTAQGS